MLRRTGFARKVYVPTPRAPIVRGRLARMGPAVLAPAPKTEVVRHEGYRRLVADLPCKLCGIVGYSQAAHPPPSGKGVKEDDRLCWPACCTRVGILGCHASFDQYILMPHDAAVIYALAAAADTRRHITARGLWPANLPAWPEES